MKYEVFIEKDRMNCKTKLWVELNDDRERRNIYLDNRGRLCSKVVDYGTAPRSELKPFIEMESRAFDLIFSSILSCLCSEGMKPEKESLTEGKLVAMTDHKNDLKEILTSIIEKLPK